MILTFLKTVVVLNVMFYNILDSFCLCEILQLISHPFPSNWFKSKERLHFLKKIGLKATENSRYLDLKNKSLFCLDCIPDASETKCTSFILSLLHNSSLDYKHIKMSYCYMSKKKKILIVYSMQDSLTTQWLKECIKY